jgi:uncharacterized protein involved in exopolysaccharide biosynthesis
MPEVNLTLEHYIKIIRRWWRTALAIVALVLLITLVFTLTTDDIFVAKATLLPQLDASQPGAVSKIPSRMEIFGFSPGMATPADVVLSLLESRTVAAGVVDALDLVSAWEVEGEPDRIHKSTVSRLQRQTRVVMDERGLISVRVEDTDRERVAAIVNSYIGELDRANRELSTSSAAYTREFIDGRLNETRERLLDVQAKLQAFQVRHGALDMEEQIKTTVEVVAQLQGELETLRARREALTQSRSPGSAEIRATDVEIGALEARVRALTAADPDTSAVPKAEGVLLPLGDVPALSAEFTRMKLALEIQAEVYAMLSQQYEQAKIDAARTLPTIQILDRGVSPLWRTRPRLKLYMAIGFVLGSALALVAVLGLDRLVPQEGSEKERWRILVQRYPAAWKS